MLYELRQVINGMGLRYSREVRLQFLFGKFFKKSPPGGAVQADNLIHHFWFAHVRLLSLNIPYSKPAKADVIQEKIPGVQCR